MTVISQVKLLTHTRKAESLLLLGVSRYPPVHLLHYQATQKPHFKGNASEKGRDVKGKKIADYRLR